jgi:hypothetical protein
MSLDVGHPTEIGVYDGDMYVLCEHCSPMTAEFAS